ncbi:MAG: winged helix-turn-helix transcriptional regulator [Candidatus Buchananbacteria bacterium]|nr:winged helix-turn-helix transcriptional regulator [Candidatus Buchananbacteria bacterium]
MVAASKKITNFKKQLNRLDAKMAKEAQLHFVLSDPTRLKILFLLKKRQEICVSDLASVLELTVSAVSHQLSLLERSHLIRSHKMGKTVCYQII